MNNRIMSFGFLALLAISRAVCGQITINQSDAYTTVGSISRSTTMSQFPAPNLDWNALSSGSGGGNTWDFSNVTFDFGAYTSTVINASAAPSNSSFPGATKAWRTDFVSSWTYFSTPTNEIRMHGSISTYGVLPDTIKIIYDEPSLQYKFPISGNSTWISKWQYSMDTYDNNDSLLYTSTTRDSIQWVCDAWGTIKYKNKQSSAIRAKGTMFITSTIVYPGLPPVVTTSSTEHLQFMTIDYNGGGVYVTKSITPGGTYYSGSTDYRFIQVATPVREVSSPLLPSDFIVGQNSPNPFNPETSIDYSIAKSVPVRFEVFDVLGRAVWYEDFGIQAAGNYQIRWRGYDEGNNALPSGVYLYRLTAGDKTETRKMMLLK